MNFQRTNSHEKEDAEFKLRQKALLLRSLVESISIPVFYKDAKGVFLGCNKAFEEYIGKSKDQITGKKVYDLYVERLAKEYDEADKSLFRNPGARTFETQVVDAKNQLRDVEINKSVFRDERGEVAGIVGVIHDITVQKQAESQLKESEERFRVLVEQAADCMILHDLDGAVRDVNPHACETYQYSREKLLKMNVSELAPGYSELLKQSAFMDSLEPYQPFTFDAKQVKKDGETMDVEVRGCLIYLRGEKLILGMWRDISRHRTAIQQLQKSRANILNIIEKNPDAVFITDDEHNIVFANAMAEKMFGRKRGELVGSPFGILLAEDSPTEIEFVSLEGKTGNGEMRVIDFEWEGKPASLVMIRDITTRKKTEETLKERERQLRQSQKLEAIGTLAGGIAHDFNNILSAVMGFTELSLYEVEKGSDLESNLMEVYSAGKRATDLVRHILTFARQTEDEFKPVKVSLIAKEALKLLRSTIPTSVEIRQNMRSESLVMADPTRIHQILMNLCTNAAQAMEENGGRLEVSLLDEIIDGSASGPASHVEPGEYLKIVVSDTGRGIPEKHIPLIFEPYFTTKDIGEGTGLGLAVVHGIVKGCRGDIVVESEMGKGTTFSVYLPAIRQRTEKKTEAAGSVPTGDERILFVDDEPVICKIGERILGRLGYDVTTRTSGLEALELIRKKPGFFDLLVTDMTMPQIGGDKLAEAIMEIDPDLPVILCTGYSKKISKEKTEKLGIKAFSMKPLTSRGLASTVRKVLDDRNVGKFRPRSECSKVEAL